MVYKGTTFRGSKSGQVVASVFSRETLEPDEVVVEITHSGLCGTGKFNPLGTVRRSAEEKILDLHYLKKDMVLGHEGQYIALYSNHHLTLSSLY